MPNVQKELEAFDNLPKHLRDALNYTNECLDPRYILGKYKTEGLKDTLRYLDDIGMLPMGELCLV